jgi:pimeloyl-ACP methyl ester carboxylesterase
MLSPALANAIRGLLRVTLFGAVCGLGLAPDVGSTHAGTDQGMTAVIGSVQFHACELSSNGQRRQVQCADVKVPEDPETPNGEQLALRIVRLQASAGTRPDAPLLAIAGGPGQAASEAFLYLDRVFPDVALQRDIYLIDQRGTGGSRRQDCELDDEALMQVEPDPRQIRDASRRCLREFDGDPTLYTTSVAVRDLEQVRDRLGLEQWHLFGVSYGTRVVQHYLRRHPQVIRSAILDSVVPADRALGPDIALRSQQALDAFLRRCAGDRACNDAFPELKAGLTRLLRRLDESPLELHYESLRTGEFQPLRFTRAHLVGVLRLALYDSQQLATLPPKLHAAYANDNFVPLARSAEALAEQMAKTLAVGMHNAVVCTEDVPFFDVNETRRQMLQKSYMGDLVVRSLELTCEDWPRGRMDEGFREPVRADVPTLLVSGEFDPITPPAYADAVLQQLPRARHLVVPGQGHFVSRFGCMPRILAQFLDSGQTEDLATTCLDRLTAAPPFVNFNGPRP